MRPELVDGSVAEQDVKARDVKALAGGPSSASRIRGGTFFSYRHFRRSPTGHRLDANQSRRPPTILAM